MGLSRNRYTPSTVTRCHGRARSLGAVLIDTFGRVATDLRVSLTDRCNLRCTYCMPPEGLDWLPKDEVLTDDEIVRLVGIARRRDLGITEVRFTGGEPLLRPGLVGIVARGGRAAPPPECRSPPTASGWPRTAAALARRRAGPGQRLASTPSTRAVRELTRRDRLDDVARRARRPPATPGSTPVKVNAVLMRGINDDEAPALLRLVPRARLRAALHRADAARRPARLEPRRDGHRRGDPRRAATAFTLTPDARGRAAARRPSAGSSTAARPRSASSPRVTRPFCGACDRTRLTADGQIRNCLFAREESDLRAPLRAGAATRRSPTRWRVAMWGKKAGPRHRRPDVPAARPADVGDRRLKPRQSSSVWHARLAQEPAQPRN